MAFLRGFAAFLDYRYWLDPQPVPLGPALVGGIFAFFGWFIILGIVCSVVSRTVFKGEPLRARILRKFAGLLSITGVMGLLLLFLAYEQIPVFGMRLWLIPLSAYFFARLGLIVVHLARDYPREKAEIEEKKRLARYMPKRR